MNEKKIEKAHELMELIKSKVSTNTSTDDVEAIVKEFFDKENDIPERKVSMDTKNVSVESLIRAKATRDEILELQSKNDDIYLMATLLKTNPRSLKSWEDFSKLQKSLVTGGDAGTGNEYVPTGFSNKLYDAIRLELQLANNLISIDMPSNPFSSPIIAGDSSAYYVPEADSDDTTSPSIIPATAPTTGKFTLEAKKLGCKTRFSDELSEDSIVPILPMLQKNIAIGLATALENAIINGDTSNSPMDADLTSSSDPRKAFNGLRKLVSSAFIDFGGELTISKIRALRASMGVYGINPANLILLASPSAYFYHLLNLNEVLTADKYGDKATIITGELAKIDNIPIIVSSNVKETLDRAGVVPSGGSTYTEIILFNKLGYALGNRGQVKVEVGRDIENGQEVLVSSMRKAFAPIYGASAPAVAIGYNLSSVSSPSSSSSTTATESTTLP